MTPRLADEPPPITVHVTPHTLRRTYISLMLAARADVPYVQDRVGHTNPRPTLEIYALVLKRRDRQRFADAFDALMRDAIPSMQQEKMLNRSWHPPVNVGSQRLPIAA